MAKEARKVIPLFKPAEESYLYGSTILAIFRLLWPERRIPVDQDSIEIAPSSFYKVTRWGIWRIE
jgi:hypothetical protein